MVIRDPFHRRRIRLLVDGSRVQRDGLVRGHVAPAFALAGEQLGVEAPCNDRVDDSFVGAVHVVFFGDCEELALAASGSGSGWGLLLLNLMSCLEVGGGQWVNTNLFNDAFCVESNCTIPASAIETTSCILTSSMFSSVCELRKFFRQKPYSFDPGVLRARFHEQYALYTVRRSESPAGRLVSCWHLLFLAPPGGSVGN